MSTDVVPAAVPAATDNTDGAPPAKEEEVGFKVFAGNLAYATTDEGLRAFFSPVAADVLSAHVILRGTRSAGYGFVALSTLAAAEKAVAELNKQELDGRTVIIEIAKPAEEKTREKSERKVGKKRVGRRGGKAVPGEVTDAEANGEVSDKIEAPESGAEAPAPAKPKKAKKSKPRRRKGKAAGDQQEGATGEAAPAPETTTENGAAAPEGEAAAKKPRAKRTPRPPRVPRAEGEAPVGEPSKNMLFVANLAFDVDDAALSEIFTSAGVAVVSARVVRRRYGQPRRSKGYGFVDVGTEEEQKKAIELTQGKEIEGRAIAVKIAVNAPHENGDDAEAEGAHAPAPVETVETAEKIEASPETAEAAAA